MAITRKDPSEMTVEEKLKTLFQLQVTLSAIDEKRALRGELPLEVEDLQDEIEGQNTRLQKIKDEIADYQSAVAQKRNEIEQYQQSVDRYKSQLDTVRNNREYDNLSKEIEFQELEIELANKKIKEAMTKVNERQEDLKKVQESISDRQADLVSKREELDDIMQETREAETDLKDQAKELEAHIEPRLLQSFKRIRKGARNGLGIVYVQRDACGGCFNKIPPQRQIAIKQHKKIIVCEYCGRILIDPELAGIKVEPKVEEKPKRKRTVRKKKTEDTAE